MSQNFNNGKDNHALAQKGQIRSPIKRIVKKEGKAQPNQEPKNIGPEPKNELNKVDEQAEMYDHLEDNSQMNYNEFNQLVQITSKCQNNYRSNRDPNLIALDYITLVAENDNWLANDDRRNDSRFRESFARLSDSLCDQIFARFGLSERMFLFNRIRYLTIHRNVLRQIWAVTWNDTLLDALKRNVYQTNEDEMVVEKFFIQISPYIIKLNFYCDDFSPMFVPEMNHLESIKITDLYHMAMFCCFSDQYAPRLTSLEYDDQFLYDGEFNRIVEQCIGKFVKLKQMKFQQSPNKLLNNPTLYLEQLSVVWFVIFGNVHYEQFVRFTERYRQQIESVTIILYLGKYNRDPDLMLDGLGNLTALKTLSLKLFQEAGFDHYETWNRKFSQKFIERKARLPKTVTKLSIEFHSQNRVVPNVVDEKTIVNVLLEHLPNLKIFSLKVSITDRALNLSLTSGSSTIEKLVLSFSELYVARLSHKILHCSFGSSLRSLCLSRLTDGLSFPNFGKEYKELEVLRLQLDSNYNNQNIFHRFDLELVSLLKRLPKLRALIIEGYPLFRDALDESIEEMLNRAIAKPTIIFQLRILWCLPRSDYDQVNKLVYPRMVPNNLRIYYTKQS